MINDKPPAENALYFAEMYMQGAYDRMKTREASAKRTSDALSKLQASLSTFQSAVSKLSSQSSLQKFGASVSRADAASVVASAGAKTGSYNFHVTQLATAHQLSVDAADGVKVDQGGELRLSLGDGSEMRVDLTKAKPDADGNLSMTEVARLINESGDNGGKINASVLTVNGQARLVLTAGETGVENAISIDASAVGSADLRAAFGGAREVVAAKDAKFSFGGAGGIEITQGSNTFTGIEGLSVTFNRVSEPGESPLQINVTRDEEGTAQQVQSLVDAYNTIIKVLRELGASGDANKGVESGPMAGDSGIRALELRLGNMIRAKVGGVSLFDLGVSGDRNGVLSLDASKLQAQLAKDGTVLDRLLGDDAGSVTRKLGEHMDTWLGASGGFIRKQMDSVGQIQNALSNQKTSLDRQYDRVYQRYLAQFNRVSVLEDQMKYTMALLDSLNTTNGK